MAPLIFSLRPDTGMSLWWYLNMKNALLGNSLQLPNLFVQVGDVLLDDVGQLLDLHRLVVEDRFSLCQQGQLLKLRVGRCDVFANTPVKLVSVDWECVKRVLT